MAKTFTVMQGNVGANVQDTSTALATKVGVWLNDAHQDAANRYNWSSLIDDDHTFESVVDQSEYSLESDFMDELALVNTAQGYTLNRATIKGRWDTEADEYSEDAIASGTPKRYSILLEASKLKLDPPPLVAETYAMPYKKAVGTLSGTDTPTITAHGIDNFMVLYATGQALTYKRRIADGDWYLNRAEFELKKIIHSMTSRANQRYQRVPDSRWSGKVYRFTGDVSYDTV